VAAVSHLFQFCYWFARTYGQTKPPADLTFDPRTLPTPGPPPSTTAEQIQELQQELEESELARQRVKNELVDQAKLKAEVDRLRGCPGSRGS
jgi:hypothetical protein